MKNENDLNEMGEILDCLGKYVPSIENIEYEDEDELNCTISTTSSLVEIKLQLLV